MLIGREKELQMLSEMYNSKHFRCMVMYGRPRSGKTSILREFTAKKDVVFFRAQAKNDHLNLADFSKVVHGHFDEGDFGSFSDWDNAFSYMASKLGDKKLILIIEEIHFIAAEYPSIYTLLQRTIDRYFRSKNVFLILCDSNIAHVENIILGYGSPLYGRIHGQMIVMTLDYLNSSRFWPNYSPAEKILSYGILGGTPGYACQFNDSLPIADNIAQSILGGTSFLKYEPQAMLRMELRDPAVYNSILESVACGASRMNDISVRIHEESQKCAKYLNTLRLGRFIDKITPLGEEDYSKKSLYMVSDNFFAFWYRFVFNERSSLELHDPVTVAKEILGSEDFHEYMNDVFKGVCLDYIIKKAANDKLPFKPTNIGRWWSGSSKRKKCSEIDVTAIDDSTGSALFGKCKFGGTALGEEEYNELLAAVRSFGKVKEAYYYFFSKEGFTDGMKEKARKNKNIKLIEVHDLFKI